MTGPSISDVLHSIASYGYPLLFAASAAEATFVVGLLVPGDIVVALGGISAARGMLDVATVYVIVALGTIVGSQISYWIGQRGGQALVLRWGERVDVRAARIEATRSFFRQHGAKAVFLAVFVAGMKNLVPALAGATGMSAARFWIFNTVGCVVRSALVVGIGYALGANLDRALAVIGSVHGWAAVVLACLVLWFVAQRVRGGRRKA